MNWTERLAKVWNLGNAKLQTRNCGLRFAVYVMLKVSIARIAMARCTREAKFEAVQRHYIEIYQSNFLLCYIKFIPL